MCNSEVADYSRKSCSLNMFKEIEPGSSFFDDIVNVGGPRKCGVNMNAK